MRDIKWTCSNVRDIKWTCSKVWGILNGHVEMCGILNDHVQYLYTLLKILFYDSHGDFDGTGQLTMLLNPDIPTACRGLQWLAGCSACVRGDCV